MTEAKTIKRDCDVVVIGAGFAGLYLLHKLRERGFAVRVFERGSGVGGTWYWNRYPGARCDVDSVYYSYSFSREIEQEWNWTERYAAQPEILAYLEFVADRLDLRNGITFNTTVTECEFVENINRWTVKTSDGETLSPRYLIAATGCLSSGRIPDIEGLGDFAGETHHTGSWPHDGVDFRGKRVGIIGTGSSGVQAIPVIAKDAAELTVFQRSATFTVPAKNRPLPAETMNEFKDKYSEVREMLRWSFGGVPSKMPKGAALKFEENERSNHYKEAWNTGGTGILGTYEDILVSGEANDTLADFIRTQIDEIVLDRKTANKLKPYGFPVGSKRICIDTEYYGAFNRENVHLVDLKATPIVRIVRNGIETSAGVVPLDMIVFATGYDAITGSLDKISIKGRGGKFLSSLWRGEGPKTYLGISVNQFPNFFMVTGPGSPCVLSNMVVSIEQHVDWISDHLVWLETKGYSRSEAKEDAQTAWVDHVNQVAQHTLYLRANSWYLGANVPGKPRVFMPYAGGVGPYRKKCDEVAQNNYEGFELTN